MEQNMKWKAIYIGTLLLIVTVFTSFRQIDNFPILKGLYLGQKSPGNTSKVFMDAIISTVENPEMCAAFTADGKEFCFNRRYKDRWTIFFTKEVEGKWTTPKPMPFSSIYTDRDFTMSPDGQRIYFGSNRPSREGENPQKSLDIYVTERGENDVWKQPRNLDHPINTPEFGENYPSVARNGNLYFFSCRNDSFGGCEIYMSQFSSNRYSVPVNLGPAINSENNDWDAFIAPDESFIIFSSQNREDSLGAQDLYIAYKKDGVWTKARNMGKRVNSFSDEICPSVSLDGKYLFFTTRRRGKADIYWISSKIIEKLKPKDLR
jgi:Tol biopolymer transport system component